MPHFVPSPGDFPTAVEIERISTLKKYASLYEGRQFSVFGLHNFIKRQYKNESDLVYLANPIPARVSDFYGDFVVGDLDRIVIQASKDASDEAKKFVEDAVVFNDIVEMVVDMATEQSEFGFVPLTAWIDEASNFNIQRIPQDQYFPQPDGSVIVATFAHDPDAPESNELFVLIVWYYLDIETQENVIIARTAWKTDGTGVIQDSISLEKMAEILGRTQPLVEMETIKGLGELNIIQIDNTKKSSWGFGKSDYADVFPQLAEVNERMTHVSTQLLKNLDAKLVLPAEMFDEDGNVRNFDTIGLKNSDGVDPHYLTNNNALLEDTREHIMLQLQLITVGTAVPMFALVKSDRPERVESLRISLFGATRKASTKRARIVEGLNDIFRIGFKMAGIEHDGELEVMFTDVMPVDEAERVDAEAEKVRSGLSSKRSSIMRLEGIDEQEAEAEMVQIASEERVAGIDITNPPQLPVVPPALT